MNNEQLIPVAIKLYLNEIAERLWSGHAAVMVGAGFSKNAKKSNASTKNTPDWSQLGDVFYEKIYGEKPNEQHYLNVLKLADELQAAFGRPALDQIIRSQIPDKEYEPSKLHIKLMELPWSDVFTTNYDTLLERSTNSVFSQKFDVVINKGDLVYSERPRIIKLHGSFPSERPFIITEEDYRKYPKEFAPFVNTVQQSLLENTLCLIGFSGDDPNFLQWIGWIRDNLGNENSSKIFLIGIFKLSDAQKKLLEKRNIVLVDLSICNGVNGNHQKALGIFLDYLSVAKKGENNLDWPKNQENFNVGASDDTVTKVLSTIKKWESTRNCYPKWLILPEDRRNILWFDTEHDIRLFNTIDKLNPPNDFYFLYELNWRLERCLCPIFNDIVKNYERILRRYNPFPEIIEGIEVTPKKSEYIDLPWSDIQHKWLELNISLLRFYREEGLTEKWDTLNQMFSKLNELLTPELVARLNYERCLYALFHFNLGDLRTRIKEWPINTSLPMWEAKRASILAEIGDIDGAERILEQSLSDTRKQLNLSPISNNYLLVSQESYIMVLLLYISNVKAFESFKKPIKNQEFTERWSYLKQYKCDPRNELELFKIKLERLPVIKTNCTQKSTFDIGRVTISYNFGGIDEDTMNAYSFLRFCEESGIPFKLQNMSIATKPAEGALIRIFNTSFFWASTLLIRICDEKNIDNTFNREFISKLDILYIDSLVSNYLSAIENALPDISSGNEYRKNRFAMLLAMGIPEILSRLCVKCSDSSRRKILLFLQKVYSHEKKNKFKGIDNLMKRLILTFSDYDQYKLIPKLLEFPVLENLNDITEREFPDPFYFLTIDYETIKNNIEIDNQVIKQLIQYLSACDSKRKIAAIRLETLYKLNLLNSDEIIEFSKALWSQIDQQNGFPINTSFYNFAFLKLPHPEGINPTILFKEALLNQGFPVQGNKQGISMSGGDIPLFKDILGGTKDVEWTEDEVLTILKRLIEWWDLDKHYLKEDNRPHLFGSISDEFRKRFRHMVDILSYVIASSFSQNISQEIKADISRLVKELNEFGIPCLRAKTAFIKLIADFKNNNDFEIQDALCSNSHSRIVDALYAVLQMLKLPSRIEGTDYVLILISQQIKWRRENGLVSSLEVMSTIVSEYPDLLTKNLLSDVLIGLNNLSTESDLLNIDSNIDILDRLSYRKSAAKLAYYLFVFYSNNDDNIPEPIIEWRNICLNKNEFVEIQNEWIKVE